MITSTEGDWKVEHPDSWLIAEDGGIGRPYQDDPLRGRDEEGPIFPIGDVDQRLPVQEPVLGIFATDGTPVGFVITTIDRTVETITRLFTMSIAELVVESERLAEQMDSIVESIGSIEHQAIADSAWYRLCSVNAMVRDEGGGANAATLARSLLEEAAYWDWAAATGVTQSFVPAWAAHEYSRLSDIAEQVEDDTWLGWVLPPGAKIVFDQELATPRSPADAVKRLGHGFDESTLGPMKLTAIGAVYRVLGVLSHGNLVGAALTSEGAGRQLPERLAAIVLHVAATSASAVVTSVAPPDPRARSLQASAAFLATSASEIHGLGMNAPVKTGRPAKGRAIERTNLGSSITHMPSATKDVTDAGSAFLAKADELNRFVLVDSHRPRDGEALIAMQAYLLSLSHLDILRGTLDGRLGRALLPFSARALFEEGARWEWLQESSAVSPAGDSLRAFVATSLEQREGIRTRLTSDGIPSDLVSELLGAAEQFDEPVLGTVSMPDLDDLLSTTHRNSSGVDSARPIYSILSQFIHATPIATMHIHRDSLSSLSAPIWSVSVEAACRGFQRIAAVSLRLADVDLTQIGPLLEDLDAQARKVAFICAGYHFLG